MIRHPDQENQALRNRLFRETPPPEGGSARPVAMWLLLCTDEELRQPTARGLLTQFREAARLRRPFGQEGYSYLLDHLRVAEALDRARSVVPDLDAEQQARDLTKQLCEWLNQGHAVFPPRPTKAGWEHQFGPHVLAALPLLEARYEDFRLTIKVDNLVEGQRGAFRDGFVTTDPDAPVMTSLPAVEAVGGLMASSYRAQTSELWRPTLERFASAQRPDGGIPGRVAGDAPVDRESTARLIGLWRHTDPDSFATAIERAEGWFRRSSDGCSLEGNPRI